MSEGERIGLTDIVRKLPAVVRRLPSILKGAYYFALIREQADLTMGDILVNNANKHGDVTAILYESRAISYSQLNALVNKTANYLHALGIERGDVIALNMQNRPEVLAIIMAAAKLGAACAMFNTAQRSEGLVHSLTLTRPRAVIIGEEQMEAWHTATAAATSPSALDFEFKLFVPDIDILSESAFKQWKRRHKTPEHFVNLISAVDSYRSDEPRVLNRPVAGDTAVYLFTSGTTGLPKAAPSSHLKWFKAYGGFGHMALALKPDDVVYVPLPLYHGTGLLVCWGAALAGSCAIAIRRKFSATQFWDDVRRFDATVFGYVGELCRYLLAQAPSPRDKQHRLTRMIGNGLRPSIWKPFKKRFGIKQVSELYAASEGNIGFSNFLNLDNTVGFSTAPFALVQYKEGTREPVRNKHGQLTRVAQGEPGLLLGEITERWKFEGYSQSEATEQAIVRDAFKKADAWFNTGDVLRSIGWRHLQFVDRMGDTFRWKGENVSTTEVENILDDFNNIGEVIVYGVEIPEGSGRVGMATVTLAEPSAGLDTNSLLLFLEERLPRYALPVFLRVTPEIEKTATFKYKKVDLKKLGYSARPGDSLYVLHPDKSRYVRLTLALAKQIDDATLRF
ncbi:long-chain-acyl-CoA synthetase [Allohahella marinimesophila]|uniref:Long-chain-acyl-CoA synthetase n=1 Tax=Allohahella marinimesophila TaxID=1054972 RepID=A0ABP7NH02_9GAMM